MKTTVVQHFSPSEGTSRGFQAQISFADANLKDCSRTSPLRDEGFWRVKGAPGMAQNFEHVWSHNFLEMFLNFS